MQKNESTTSRPDLRLKILEKAVSLFKEKGIKSVRMDDIAQSLAISKRTLYEEYANKEQLLLEVIIREHERRKKELNEFSLKAENVMQLVVMVLRQKIHELGVVSPLFYSELSRYKPVKEYLTATFEENRQQSMAFFLKGVESGFFRKDVSYDIFSLLTDAQLSYVMNTRMYEQFPLKDIFETFVNVQLRGICTEKGRRILDRSYAENGSL